ncbi:MAG: AMP-binding protein [Chloroflexi bacterium]|nr:AMP-binding protein [Chloroflexota bacterium]
MGQVVGLEGTWVRPEDVAEYRRAGYWPGILLTDRLWEVAKHDPGRVAIVDSARSATYGELADEVVRLAIGLRGLGIGAGDVGIIQLPNWHEFLVFHLALTALGALTVNLPPIYREREVRTVARSSGAKLLVVPERFRGFDYTELARTVRADASSLEQIFVVRGSGPGCLTYGDFMEWGWERLRGLDESGARGREVLESLRPDPDVVSALGYTSGTTGEPKGAMHTHNALHAINVSVIERYRLTERDRIFMPSPLGHSLGFTHGARLAVYLGATLVLQDVWDPGVAVELIQRHRCTLTFAATPFLQDVVYHSAIERADGLRTLRTFLCGGAPVPEQLLRDAKERLPNTFVSAYYGITEGGAVTMCPLDAPQEKIVGSDGKALLGMQVLIVGPDGEPLPSGAEGELLIRGPQNVIGYYQRPDLANAFREDGFFCTGDLARMDSDGYIRITGRIKELIIRGGVNLAPAEVENILFEHPKIARVAVLGLPDERLGERVCACVIPQPNETLTLAEVQEWMARAGAAKQKWPERVELMTEFPLTAAGKVQKHVLRQWIRT